MTQMQNRVRKRGAGHMDDKGPCAPVVRLDALNCLVPSFRVDDRFSLSYVQQLSQTFFEFLATLR